MFGQIAAKEFVSVQPMNLPSGLVFFLDFQYGTEKTPFALNGSLYGNGNSAQYPFSTTAPGTGGLYGAGRFIYSTNQFSASNLEAFTVASASWAELNFNSDYSASVAAGQIKKFTLSNATSSYLLNMDPDAVRGFVFASGALFTTSSGLQLPEFTNYNYTANTIAFFVTGTTAQVGGVGGADRKSVV